MNDPLRRPRDDRFSSWEESLWDEQDHAIFDTTMFASNLERGPVRDTIFRALTHIKWVTYHVRRLSRDIVNSWQHTIRHTREIVRLERQVENLQTRLSRLEDRHVEEAAAEAVEALENGADIEEVLDMLGRPEPVEQGEG